MMMDVSLQILHFIALITKRICLIITSWDIPKIKLKMPSREAKKKAAIKSKKPIKEIKKRAPIEWKKIRKGSRIAVHYPDGRYACDVMAKKGNRFELKFDDGSKDWKNMARTKFEWIDILFPDEEESDVEDIDEIEDFEASESEEEEEDSSDEGKELSDVEKDDEALELDSDGEDLFDHDSLVQDTGGNGAKKEKASGFKGKKEKEKVQNSDKQDKENNNICEEKNTKKDSENQSDEDSNKGSKKQTSKKSKKGKLNASDNKTSKRKKETQKDTDSDIEDDGSDATPTMQCEEESSNIVTPPTTKRPKVSSNDSKQKIKGVKKVTKKNEPKKTVASVSTDFKKKRMKIADVKKASEKKEITKIEGLLLIMLAHHMVGIKSNTKDKIISDIGYKPPNKLLDRAWKDIVSENLIEETGVENKKKTFGLTEEGIDKVASDGYKHELENPPKTIAELHERIKTNALNQHTITIFESLRDARDNDSGSVSMSRKELQDKCGVKDSNKGFGNALKQHKNCGYVVPDPAETKNFILSVKCPLH